MYEESSSIFLLEGMLYGFQPGSQEGEADGSWCYKTFLYSASDSKGRKHGEDGHLNVQRALEHPEAAKHGLITLHLSQNLIAGNTGCYDWEAGYLLTEFVLSHPHLFKGKFLNHLPL